MVRSETEKMGHGEREGVKRLSVSMNGGVEKKFLKFKKHPCQKRYHLFVKSRVDLIID